MDPAVAAFLIACLRSRFDPAALDAARALAPTDDLEWAAVRRAIYAEGVAPLLHAISARPSLFPADIEAELAAAYRITALRNTGLLYELEAALAALAGADVPVLLLKGAALAETVYRDPALRPMADCDLLVRPADLPRAQATLIAAGYRPVADEPHPGDLARFESQMALRKEGPLPARIELHWHLLDSPYYQARLSADWFWAGAEEFRIGAVPARGPAPTPNLLYLAAHLALHHRLAGLMWWYDIAALLHTCGDRVDWEALLDQAEACDLVLPLQQVLPVIAQHWAVAVPTAVLARLAALRPSAGEARVHAWLTAEQRPVIQRFWADLAGLNGWAERLRFAYHHLFPLPAYMRRRYRLASLLLLPLAYPYRWARGLLELAHAGLRTARLKSS